MANSYKNSSSNEQRLVQDLLPPELWMEVLNRVEDPVRLSNAANTHPMWSDLLQSRKASFLFQQILPLIAHHLPKKDLLTCRLVSKSWKNGVDNFLQTLSTDPFPPFEYTRALHCMFKTHIGLVGPGDIVRFVEGVQGHTGNPLPSRSLRVDPMQDNLMRGLAACGALQQQVGQHVWNCTIHLPPLAYQLFYLMEFMSRCPNLKSLCVYHTNQGLSQPDYFSEEYRDLLRNLPRLNSLHTLKLRCYSLHPEISAELLRKHQDQLKTVMGPSPILLKSPLFQHDVISLQNLKCLSIQLVNRAVMNNLTVANWPLERLSLFHLESGIRSNPITAQSFFLAINNYAATLAEFRLGFNLTVLTEADQITDSEVNVKYSKMRNLRTPFVNLKNVELLSTILGKCPELKVLELTNSPSLKKIKSSGLQKVEVFLKNLPKLDTVLFLKTNWAFCETGAKILYEYTPKAIK